MFGAPQNNQSALFGQPAQQGNNLFGGGGNQNQPANNLFGNQNQNSMQPAKPFGGTTQGSGMFGGNTQTNTNSFGANNNSQGVFGAGNTPNQGGGLFGAQQQTNQPQGGGMFGGGGQNNNASNPFMGGNKPVGGLGQPTTGGMFGGNNPAQQGVQGGGIFGGGNTGVSQGGMFGGNTQGQSAFGNNANQSPFGGGNTQGGNLFGGNTTTNQQNQPNMFGATNNSPFGGVTQNNPVFGQNNNQQANNIFGGGNTNQQQQNAPMFGAGNNANQQQGQNMFGQNAQQQGGGNLFGQVNQANKSVFGGFNANTNANTAANTNSLWGAKNTTTTPGWNANTNATIGGQSNQLGGTSWGVNVNTNAVNQGLNMNKGINQTITPVKSKNSKIDNKHLVKCIAALDQYTGLSKQQIRCHFLLTGGMPNLQPVNNTTQAQGFGTNGALFNKPATTNGPMPSFGQLGNTGGSTLFGNSQPTNTNLGGGFNNVAKTGNNLFGATQNQTPPFGGNNNLNQGLGGFGQQQPAQGGNLFGQSQPQNQGGNLFGQTQNQGGNLFGQTQNQPGNLFGQPATQPGSLFGTTNAQQQQSNSLFGTNQTQGGSTFGINQQGSLFGGNPSTGNTGTLFGGSTQLNNQPNTGGNLFGNQAPNNNPAQSTLFGATTQLFGATQQQAQGGSLFGTQAQTPSTSLFGQSNPTQAGQTGSLFGGQGTLIGGLGSTQLNNNQQAPSLFGNTGQQTQGASLFGGQTQTGSLFPQQQNLQFQSMQSYANPNNMNLFLSVPYQKSILSNQAILDPNYKTDKAGNLMATLLTTLVQNGLLKQENVDKLLAPTPFQQLMKKAEEQKQKYDFSDDNVTSAKFPINDYNFKKWEISQDYFEQRDPEFWQTKYLQNLGRRKQFKNSFEPSKKQKQPLFDLKKQKKQEAQPKKKARKIEQYEMFLLEDGYQIKPSLQRIKMMDIQSIQQVPNVQISNKYGKAIFLEPIPLYRRDLKDCIQIIQDCIEIKDKYWDGKKCELEFYNFANYNKEKDISKRKQIQNKMNKWVKNNNMKLQRFDDVTGNLTVIVFDK